VITLFLLAYLNVRILNESSGFVPNSATHVKYCIAIFGNESPRFPIMVKKGKTSTMFFFFWFYKLFLSDVFITPVPKAENNIICDPQVSFGIIVCHSRPVIQDYLYNLFKILFVLHLITGIDYPNIWKSHHLHVIMGLLCIRGG
jgi:hypothetical protein